MELSKWSKSYKKFKMTNLERGHEYYKENKVLNYKLLEDGVFEGQVSGSNNEVYIAKLNLKYFKESTCNCPFGQEGNKCKHLAALYFAIYGDEWYEDYLNEYYEPYETYDPYYEEELEEYIEEKINKYVNSLTKYELKEILKNFLYNEPNYIEQLEYEFYKKNRE